MMMITLLSGNENGSREESKDGSDAAATRPDLPFFLTFLCGLCFFSHFSRFGERLFLTISSLTRLIEMLLDLLRDFSHLTLFSRGLKREHCIFFCKFAPSDVGINLLPVPIETLLHKFTLRREFSSSPAS